MASLDYETYSEAGFVPGLDGKWHALPNASQGKKGLFVVGAARYAEHPSTEVLTLSYDLGAGVRRWRPGQALPADLFAYVAAGGLLQAWNSAFEHWVWNTVCVPRYGWPVLPQRQLRCTMARSRAHAYPGKLLEAARVMGLAHQKDADGTRLLDKFSKPRNPTKKDPRRRVTPDEDPVDFILLQRYCDADVLAEADAAARVPELEGEELEFWLADQAINYRGVRVDMASVENLASVVDAALERYNVELHRLTGIERASMVQQLQGWLHAQGVHLDSLDEETVETALTWELQPHVRRVLEIRQAIGSAAVKKLYAMRNQATRAGRLHDLFSYHAAHTGRATGNGPQPTNLPNSGPRVYRCECGHHFGQHLTACPWCGAAA